MVCLNWRTWLPLILICAALSLCSRLCSCLFEWRGFENDAVWIQTDTEDFLGITFYSAVLFYAMFVEHCHTPVHASIHLSCRLFEATVSCHSNTLTNQTPTCPSFCLVTVRSRMSLTHRPQTPSNGVVISEERPNSSSGWLADCLTPLICSPRTMSLLQCFTSNWHQTESTFNFKDIKKHKKTVISSPVYLNRLRSLPSPDPLFSLGL